jgi:hypothetical protein
LLINSGYCIVFEGILIKNNRLERGKREEKGGGKSGKAPFLKRPLRLRIAPQVKMLDGTPVLRHFNEEREEIWLSKKRLWTFAKQL